MGLIFGKVLGENHGMECRLPIPPWLRSGLVLALATAACGDNSGPSESLFMDAGAASTDAAQSQVPNFALIDQNPSSPRAQQVVTPRDYLMRVSGWYFTHAT